MANRNMSIQRSLKLTEAQNIIATSQPLAVEAGIEILKNGGNAVDAALAAAITLTVVEPTNNGIGGDAFAIIWDGEKIHGINGSGKSPNAWNYKKFAHLKEMPKEDWDSVTVPGAVSVWCELSKKFGKLDFETLFEPAIHYARLGFAVTPKTALLWELAQARFKDFPNFKKTFLVNGNSPNVGEIFKCPEQAKTLEEIARTNGESFYTGNIAKRIAACSEKEGGSLTIDDLKSHKPFWVDPISVNYRGYDIWELPPNGQGLAALVALGILNRFDLSTYESESANSIHLQVAAMKIGFSVAKSFIADPDYLRHDPKKFLSSKYLNNFAGMIDQTRTNNIDNSFSNDKGTVYLTTADSNGVMVSYIQSNYMGFGSGVVIPSTGIAMQNRGCGFTIEKSHPNQVDGGKRPYHTIIPAFVTKNSKPVLSFGVMGGPMQPQGHVQMITRIFDYNQNPQKASDSPRWFITEDNKLALEPGFENDVIEDLKNKGHNIITDLPERNFGGAQLIYKTDNGYIAGSDHRKDGLASGF
jgi:gamma-glutamyltranspeptidase/glutathione hydrolase